MFARASNLYTGAYRSALITAAQNAWTWANANPNVVFYNSGVINSGEQQTDSYETSMRQLTAAIYLLEVTGDQQYLDYVLTHYSDAHMMQWGFVYPFESAIQNALIHFAEFSVNNALSANIQNTYMQSVSQNNAELLPAFLNQSDAYMAYMSDQNYTWGSNTTKARNAIIFQNMRALNLDPTNNTNYTESSLGFVHYFHGVNPNGTCFLSNMNNHGAEKSVNSFYHGWFEDGSPLWDEVGVSVYGPPAGFIPGGPNPTYTLDSCCPDGCGSAQVNGQCDANLVSPPLGQPIQKAWKDWNAGWPQNSWTVTEIAIYTQAAYIKMLAQFVNQTCINTSIAEYEIEQKIGVKIFPNPCRDQLVVNSELLHSETTSMTILDALGRVVFQKQLINSSERSTQIINTKDLPNGMYVLRLDGQGETTVVKFLKED
jgi:hypothetical protein